MEINEIQRQINQMRKDIQRIDNNKKQKENKRKQSEALLDEFIRSKDAVQKSTGEFQQKINSRAANMPKKLRESYLAQVDSSFKEGKINDFDRTSGDTVRKLRNKIFDLDDLIAADGNKIAQKKSWLSQLLKMLESAKAALQDIVSEED